MKTSRIIKLLAGLTAAVALSSCGGGGGGGGGGGDGGGGTTDKGASYHPGSNDPNSQSDDFSQLLKGRHMVLYKGTSTFVFDFGYNGSNTVEETGHDSQPQRGTVEYPYTYNPTGETTATARFVIRNAEEQWEGEKPGSVTMEVNFTFQDPYSATCTIRDSSKGTVQGATANFSLLPK